MTLTGTTTETEVSAPYDPPQDKPIWLTLAGVWAGSVQVLRSIDGGQTKAPLTFGGQEYGRFTGNCCEEVAIETDGRARYYLDITLVSGELEYDLA